MKKLLLILVVLGGLGYGGFYYFKKWKPQPSAAQAPTRPTSAIVSSRSIKFAISATGDIGPADQVSVRPEVSGKIATLPVDIGDKVKKNDVLFTLDDSDLKIERGSRVTEIDGAKIQLARMSRNFERSKHLMAEKLISQELFEDTKTEMDLAKNKLEISQKSLEQVEDKLLKTKIRAPFDCTILTRPVSVGQAVSGSSGMNSGTEVLTVANLTDMLITAHINQADVTRLKVGQPVDIEVEAVPGLKLVGHVDRIAPQATIRNGIKGFSTRIILKNVDAQVRPGMTANLSIPLESAENVLAVPLEAVYTEFDKNANQMARFVYVKKESEEGTKYEHRPVQIGVTDYDFAEVQSGLSENEVVSLVPPPEELGNLAAPAFPGGKAPAAGGQKEKGGDKSKGGGAKKSSGTDKNPGSSGSNSPNRKAGGV